jgi:hypothetical protein
MVILIYILCLLQFETCTLFTILNVIGKETASNNYAI